jgi:hypothetical protein
MGEVVHDVAASLLSRERTGVEEETEEEEEEEEDENENEKQDGMGMGMGMRKTGRSMRLFRGRGCFVPS